MSKGDNPEDNQLDKASIRSSNHAKAGQIFDFLSTVFSLYDKPERRYIISFAKHIYRWARMTAYHQVWFGEKTNDRKIQSLMKEFSIQFDKRYLPPIEHDQKFYDIYPSKELIEFVHKYMNKTQNTENQTNNQQITVHSNNSPNDEDEKHNVQKVKTRKRRRYKKQLSNLYIMSSSNRKQNVLLFLDYDDTLIPSAVLKKKNFQVTATNTSKLEKIYIDDYSRALNKFWDVLMPLFDYNKDSNVQIVTNGSTAWVTEQSWCHSGRLFAQKLVPWVQKIGKYNIDIVSALDNWMRECHKKGGFAAMNPYKWKWEVMKQLIREYFGKRVDGSFDVKIISVGDSYQSEFLGAAEAFIDYLNKQRMDVVRNMNLSLHRVKFIEQPSWNELTAELKWMEANIEGIVRGKSKSSVHDMKKIIGGGAP